MSNLPNLLKDDVSDTAREEPNVEVVKENPSGFSWVPPSFIRPAPLKEERAEDRGQRVEFDEPDARMAAKPHRMA